jgi:hypothetical protein
METQPPTPMTKLDELTEIQIRKAIEGDTDAYMALFRLVELYDPTIESAYDSDQDD